MKDDDQKNANSKLRLSSLDEIEEEQPKKKKPNKSGSQGPDDVPDNAFDGKKFAVTGVFEGSSSE